MPKFVDNEGAETIAENAFRAGVEFAAKAIEGGYGAFGVRDAANDGWIAFEPSETAKDACVDASLVEAGRHAEEDREQLLATIKTLTAVVYAAGGEVRVPPATAEVLPDLILCKHDDPADGAVVYRATTKDALAWRGAMGAPAPGGETNGNDAHA